MSLPIQFAADGDVIAEEAARFRALSAPERLRAIHGMLAAGSLLMRRWPHEAFLRAYSQDQEDAARQAIREFIARHAQ